MSMVPSIDSDSLPCHVKIYDSPESALKLNDVFEFIGVLTFDYEVSMDKDDQDELSNGFSEDVLVHLPPNKISFSSFSEFSVKNWCYLSTISASMSGSGNPQLYRPHDMFTAMGRCWVLEDEFSYPINPNLRNSAYFHNTMRQEWAWLFREQQMFYDELVGFKLPMPRRLASQMPRDMIDELRKALDCIREENNRMKIHLNRYRTQVEIRESMEGGWYEHAQFM